MSLAQYHQHPGQPRAYGEATNVRPAHAAAHGTQANWRDHRRPSPCAMLARPPGFARTNQSSQKQHGGNYFVPFRREIQSSRICKFKLPLPWRGPMSRLLRPLCELLDIVQVINLAMAAAQTPE